MSVNNNSKVIGYFAYSFNREVFCDEDACMIFGSDVDFENYLRQTAAENARDYTIRKTRFGEIMEGLRQGGAYSFDEVAYSRFYPLARSEGIGLEQEDFSLSGEGKPFVRVSFALVSEPQ